LGNPEPSMLVLIFVAILVIFRSIAFFKARHVVMIEHPRQALIEFNFDESLSQKIASI
jgi:hypothetical protein